MTTDDAPLSRKDLQYIAGGSEWQELDSVWDNFDTPGGTKPILHNLQTFVERRDGFLWTLERLLEHGHIRLLWWTDKSSVTGTPEEQVDIIRQAFPEDDEGMEDGRWFFYDESQVGVIWQWPGRNPIPFTE
ncbi:hypothetical protein SAMN06295974_2390 [Plantibacter flavus]|uniref:DUF596 domain-containing protein n=1 Tax=Plantibacter flavus TaxID=150123 RepID=A0A3N2BYX3_9MICO|nr:DUF596 domain-containing protein [Plantibacter flavus]ROR80446.1 hypothetical protein EDD42_0487 [Plantibacter flavus]SMG34226.1 hypothetical protein SAMN06295974_2390 [Plantibacter flavus]